MRRVIWQAVVGLAFLSFGGCGPIGLGFGLNEAFEDDTRPDTVVPSVELERVGATSSFANRRDAVFNVVTNKLNATVTAVAERVLADGSAVPTSTPDVQDGLIAFVAPGDGTYRLTVTVADAVGTDTTTQEWTIDTLPPGAPSNLREIARSQTSITVRWDEAFDTPSGSGVAKYLIRYGLESDVEPLGGSNATILGITKPSPADVGNVVSVTLAGLDTCKRHRLVVSAVDAAGNEGDTSTPLSARVDCGGLFQFRRTLDLAVGAEPTALAVDHFNSDAAPDIAVANSGDGSVSVVLSVPPAPGVPVAYASAERYDVGGTPRMLAVLDSNADGARDIIVAGSDALSGTRTNGRPDGRFEVSSPGLAFNQFVALGDMDRDGITDIVTPSAGAAANGAVLVQKGNGTDGRGDGSFTLSFDVSTGAGAAGPHPTAQAFFALVADFDNDKQLDVVVAPGKQADIRIRSSMTGLSARLPVGSNSSRALAEDFDGNGILDIAVLDSTQANGAVRVFLGRGLGDDGVLVFDDPQTLPIGGVIESASCGDFNNDGIPDLAVANSTTSSIEFFEGSPSGLFDSRGSLSLDSGTVPAFIATSDLNSDGLADLVIANANRGTITIYLGEGRAGLPAGSFSLGDSLSTVDFPFDVVTADFNGDRIVDIAVVLNPVLQGSLPDDPVTGFPLSPLVSVFPGQGQFGRGNGLFGSPTSTALPTFGGSSTFNRGLAHAIAAGDFNGDNILDFAVAGLDNDPFSSSPFVDSLIGDGLGNFVVNRVLGNGGNQAIAVDVNSDRREDLVMASKDLLVVRQGAADGTFGNAGALRSGGFHSIVTGDFNLDRRVDIAATQTSPPGLLILLGQKDPLVTEGDGALGNGTFDDGVLIGAGASPGALASGDFNRDGVIDLAVADTANNTIVVLLGQVDGGVGNGRFDTANPVPGGVGSAPVAVAAVDVNGDRIIDLITANEGDGTITVLIGMGDGTFGDRRDFDTYDSNAPDSPARAAVRPIKLVAADFNGDLVTDLLVVNQGARTVQILLGANSNE